MFKSEIIGNLVRDPEIRMVNTKKGEMAVCNFTVAATDPNSPKDKDGNAITSYVRVAAWGKNAENCQKYLAKGKKVYAIGTMSASAYQATQDRSLRATLELNANRVEFLSPVSGSAVSEHGAVAESIPTETAVYDPTPEELDLPY